MVFWTWSNLRKATVPEHFRDAESAKPSARLEVENTMTSESPADSGSDASTSVSLSDSRRFCASFREEMLEKFGFTTLDEKKDAGQALALGGITNGVTNLELTAAYAAIADGGVYMPPAFYTKITDMNGNTVIDNSSPEKTQVISRETAWILTDAMKGVVSDGTGTDLQLDSAMAVAGKTGTTSDYNDVWFVGYTPYYTCGVWAGYDRDEHLPDEGIGHTYHQILWKKVMDRLSATKADAVFRMPDGNDRGPVWRNYAAANTRQAL